MVSRMCSSVCQPSSTGKASIALSDCLWVPKRSNSSNTLPNSYARPSKRLSCKRSLNCHDRFSPGRLTLSLSSTIKPPSRAIIELLIRPIISAKGIVEIFIWPGTHHKHILRTQSVWVFWVWCRCVRFPRRSSCTNYSTWLMLESAIGLHKHLIDKRPPYKLYWS